MKHIKLFENINMGKPTTEVYVVSYYTQSDFNEIFLDENSAKKACDEMNKDYKDEFLKPYSVLNLKDKIKEIINDVRNEYSNN